MTEKVRTCFVVMGYHKKKDYLTSRTLDLDLTYQLIIKPAAEAAGLRCQRNDEIRQATVDHDMFRELLLADVVVADISTANANALYELGVRHALRPRSTIVIAENGLKAPFNVSHFRIERYRHSGRQILPGEVDRMKNLLRERITSALAQAEPDSPIYYFLPGLKPPVPTKATLQALSGTRGRTLSQVVQEAKAAKALSDFEAARRLFAEARQLDPQDDWLLQQLVLCTYKAGNNSSDRPLKAAWKLLAELRPTETTDTETLGLASSIQKRLFYLTKQQKHLEQAIFFVEKGHALEPNYYNGINLALLYLERGVLAQSPAECMTDFALARRVYTQVVKVCQRLLKSKSETPKELYFVWASLAEAELGLGNHAAYERAIRAARSQAPEPWQWQSTQEQLERLRFLLDSGPGGHAGQTG